jgi:two-component system, sporulation sensor kinase E
MTAEFPLRRKRISPPGPRVDSFVTTQPELDGERYYPPSFERAAYGAIVQSVPHAVLLVDAKRHIVLVNRAAAALFGRPPARLRGLPIVRFLPADAVNLLFTDFGRQRLRVVETCLTTKGTTPSLCTIKITATPLANRKVSPYTLLVIEDISDKATLEQQLVDSEKQAAMGQLAAGLLHEVSNPLTSLGSNLLFVRQSLPGAVDLELRQALDASLDQLGQMRQLLGTLSSFPGRAAPRFELEDMHYIIRQCITFIAKDAERRKISIVATFSPAAAMCEMDIRLIKQVLLNLLKNAMEAMPDGGNIAIRTSHSEPGEASAAIDVEIADTGVGIAESDFRRVFRPLFTTKRGGAGLGLSFCRQAVEEHGGAIRIASEGKDRGTTVCITLPVRQPSNLDD